MLTQEKLSQIETPAYKIQSLAAAIVCLTQDFEAANPQKMAHAHTISKYILTELDKIIKLF